VESAKQTESPVGTTNIQDPILVEAVDNVDESDESDVEEVQRSPTEPRLGDVELTDRSPQQPRDDAGRRKRKPYFSGSIPARDTRFLTVPTYSTSLKKPCLAVETKDPLLTFYNQPKQPSFGCQGCQE